MGGQDARAPHEVVVGDLTLGFWVVAPWLEFSARGGRCLGRTC